MVEYEIIVDSVWYDHVDELDAEMLLVLRTSLYEVV